MLADHIYRHPAPGTVGRAVERLANSRSIPALRRKVTDRLPYVTLLSNVTDAAFATWLVPLERAAAHVPPGHEPVQHCGLTPFTILTYRHGHFGPRALGPVRRLLPSPIQSNWRFYLRSGSVLFVHNIIGTAHHMLAMRLLSETVPAHLPQHISHTRHGDRIRTEVNPGQGSSHALALEIERTTDAMLPDAFARMFGGWDAAVRAIALQESAVVRLSDSTRVAFGTIELGLRVADVLPARLSSVGSPCAFVEDLQPVGDAFCFIAPTIEFTVTSDKVLP